MTIGVAVIANARINENAADREDPLLAKVEVAHMSLLGQRADQTQIHALDGRIARADAPDQAGVGVERLTIGGQPGQV